MPCFPTVSTSTQPFNGTAMPCHVFPQSPPQLSHLPHCGTLFPVDRRLCAALPAIMSHSCDIITINVQYLHYKLYAMYFIFIFWSTTNYKWQKLVNFLTKCTVYCLNSNAKQNAVIKKNNVLWILIFCSFTTQGGLNICHKVAPLKCITDKEQQTCRLQWSFVGGR